MLNPEDPNVRSAQFGRQVELFLEGDIGSHLLKKASEEIEEAIKQLKEVDPYDARAVQKAQNKVKVAESIAGWLGSAVLEGHEAIEELKHAQS